VDDHVVDTNVLLVASARHRDPPYEDSDIPGELQQDVLDWLMKFREDDQRRMVLDQSFKIWDEYHNKMTRGKDLGSLVVAEKLARSAFDTVDISYDKDGSGCLPKVLESVVHDRDDRKLVAVAIGYKAKGGQCSIVTASDTDWYDWEESLGMAGVTVQQLIDEWCRAKWKEKHNR